MRHRFTAALIPSLLLPTTFLLTLVAVSGCVSQAPGSHSPEVVEAQGVDTAPIDRETNPGQDNQSEAQQTDSATTTLLAAADQAHQNNDHLAAVAYLERAVRIEPRNAKLWVKLSQAHAKDGNLQAASQHVRKAIALAGTDPVLERMAWLQLADVREAEGNPAEAKAIRRRYARLRG